ncbi:hypothetical protein MPL1032_20153 [Mesorhizobium plurifarium]|uniref:Uncharacterized protein n=1 Tax=Mesorhizobium plurifarium TaxID=69974 RepID=A0A0K2VW71_MESPL|nr:hypothetical protein MPL1032_20153 [Mesorhizobium plurifarium]
MDDGFQRIGVAVEQHQPLRGVSRDGAKSAWRVLHVGSAADPNHPTADLLQELLDRGEMLDFRYWPGADNHIRAPFQHRIDEGRNVGCMILVVGIGVDDDVRAPGQTGFDARHEGVSKTTIAGVPHDVIDTVFPGDPDRFVRASVIYHQPFDAAEAWDGPRQIAQRYRQGFGFVVARNLDNQLWQKTALELGRLGYRASTIVRPRCKRFSPAETIFPPSRYQISAVYVRASLALRADCAPNDGPFRDANVRNQWSIHFRRKY